MHYSVVLNGLASSLNLCLFLLQYSVYYDIDCFLSDSSPSLCKTREQEELEELLLLEQQGNEQRRLETLQEEQRQLQAKRKSKQALLDELVRHTHTHHIQPH